MSIRRHICSDFDLSDKVVESHRKTRLANAKVANARWAVRHYVRMLRTNGQEHLPLEPAIAKGVFQKYGVSVALLDFAVRLAKAELGQ